MAIVKDIAKHPYVLVGFSAFVLTIPLAITSNKAMMRRLRERWKKLHQLVYLIAILGVVYFWWLVKKDIREPLMYALVLALLLGIRMYYRKISGPGRVSINKSVSPQTAKLNRSMQGSNAQADQPLHTN